MQPQFGLVSLHGEDWLHTRPALCNIGKSMQSDDVSPETTKRMQKLRYCPLCIQQRNLPAICGLPRRSRKGYLSTAVKTEQTVEGRNGSVNDSVDAMEASLVTCKAERVTPRRLVIGTQLQLWQARADTDAQSKTAAEALARANEAEEQKALLEKNVEELQKELGEMAPQHVVGLQLMLEKKQQELYHVQEKYDGLKVRLEKYS